ncbi:MAG: HAD family hydrolase [Deltaproteobacteria bacterium]|jgi:phosphoglycolate phosphatase|nr:HAD family hydrolase [Deltaproteobacteria bacterium]
MDNYPAMRSIKGFIFDLDGTLLDTLEDLAAAVNKVLLGYGYAAKTRDEVRLLVGEGLRRLLVKVTGLEGENPRLEAMILKFMEDYGACLIATTRPYPGIERLLGYLNRKRIPVAVFSNKAHEFTIRLMAHFFPEISFCQVRGKMEDMPAKPDPAGVLRILEAMRLPAAEVAFVGDTRVDMETAGNSGTFPIGVSWGFRSAAELREHGARIVLNHPGELEGF